jgi:membrane protease YdiL (CAAX protease family)
MNTMFRKLTNFREALSQWVQAAQRNAANANRMRGLPMWLAVGVVLFDCVLISLWSRYTRDMSLIRGVMAAVSCYVVRLSVVTATLILVCRHYRISGEFLGIRPSKLISDFRWSSRICLVSASIIIAVLFVALVTAQGFGICLPEPPQSYVQILGSSYPIVQFVAISVLASAVLIIFAAVTEELVYRSVFLPALVCRIGLFPSVAVTAGVFGLAHVIGSDRLWIPVPEIVGGLLMAAGFSIRWSVVPAMVIHGMGNLVSSALVFIYVQLFKAYPTWFGSQ